MGFRLYPLPMGTPLSKAANLFFQGDYQKLLARTLDHPTRRWKRVDLGFVLGSLCFVGRTEEAEMLFTEHFAKLDSEQRIQCRFFLGLGFTRRSNYALARRYFAKNRRDARKKISPLANYYVFFGLSFYRYFCGKWALALRDLERSFAAALRANFLYGRVLSSDLRGHLLVQMGQIQPGLKNLRQAQSLALKLGNEAVGQAIENSRVVYEAQFGIRPREIMATLFEYLETTRSLQDTYSQSQLLLELARQYILRGKFTLASSALDQAAQQIYSHQNRRQEVQLNLRYAYLAFLTGESARGLSYVQAAKRALDPEVDHALKLAVLGLEYKLARDLKMPEHAGPLTRQLLQESILYGGAVNRKMLARLSLRPYQGHRAEDVLGELRDLVAADSDAALDAVLASEYYAFLFDILPAVRGRQILYLDLAEDTLTLFDRGGVSHAHGLTPLLRTLLFELSSGSCSKERLIQSVWRYSNYHPLHHDPVIYQAVANLRKLLVNHLDWIQTTEDGYRLREGVELRSQRAREISRPKVKSEIVIAEIKSTYDERLNFRQMRFLRHLKPQQFITVHDYKKTFRVSEITAGRDLALLHQLGLVVRVGRARATRYVLSEGEK